MIAAPAPTGSELLEGGATQMDRLYDCCCGLDVHKQTVVACLIRPTPGVGQTKAIRTFATTTDELDALADWLAEAGCTHVAMESTGVYWKPVHNRLDGRFTILVANAQHIKAMPGRKTDVKDCEWIADLLQHGLITPSFIPDRAQRELRDLTRTRTTLIDERSRTVLRLQKVLEDANIKLSGVATDIMGVSGRAILDALVSGQTDPALLADLAKGKLRAKRQQLERALAGRMGEHHCLLVGGHLAHIDFLDEQIEQLSQAIAERLRPFAAELERLETIPGIKRRTAEVLAAEIGLDMSHFPTAGHLASWAGMCPGNHESAGRRRTGKTRRGSKWLRRALVQSAQAATRKKGCYPAVQYRRLIVRGGAKKALVAVGHTLLITVYHLLARQDVYHDLSPLQFDAELRARAQKRATQQLQALGYDVTLTLKSQAA
jgi:transposase